MPANDHASSSSSSGTSRVPAVKSPFTISEIRRAIPSHCFSRPLTTSFLYLFADLLLVALLLYASTFISSVSDAHFGNFTGGFLRAFLWLCYWVCQGCVMTGLWVIGHECGHRGFAESEFVNDTVGLVVHSFLLVPYFSWRISHQRHHSNTGSIEHDEVYVPHFASAEQIFQHRGCRSGTTSSKNNNIHDSSSSSSSSSHHSLREESGALSVLDSAVRVTRIIIMLTLGWPLYLFFNAYGNKSYDPRAWVNHFFPSSPIFAPSSSSANSADRNNRLLVVVSDIALIAVLSLFTLIARAVGFATFFYLYIAPYLIVNAWLVLITFLQHTDLALPHYNAREWEWLRGALATVDRDYGVLNVVFHHIADTHVVHHLFKEIPHYHAQEATKAVIPILGEYYRRDSTPVHLALWKCFGSCNLLYPDPKLGGVFWFD